MAHPCPTTGEFEIRCSSERNISEPDADVPRPGHDVVQTFTPDVGNSIRRAIWLELVEPRAALGDRSRYRVGGQYRRQPTLDPARRLLRHGTQILPIENCTTDQTTVPNAF